MKSIIIAIFLIASINSNGQGTQKKLTDLVGIWQFTGEQNAGAYLEIIDSSNIILSYNGEKKKIIEYKIDFQKSPIWFDFSTSDTSSIVTIKSLLEVTGDSMLKWQLFIDEERTPFFSSTRGELVYLRKAKQSITTAAVKSN
jgi:hypothetical protein